ncbi:hypothetical protein [Amycolatopsis jejuensis]|uniref:WXG100-like domain-containing protein n=1 Tax=Amycolatopsis jejuensis TaxID=330084 RepID=UPI00068EE8B8|nr:hypothetical protein [Amycolatopsis jejuensis]
MSGGKDEGGAGGSGGHGSGGDGGGAVHGAGSSHTVHLPAGLQKFFKVVLGMSWPEGDEYSLWQMSYAWTQFGVDLADLAARVEALSPKAAEAMKGKTADAFNDYLNTLSKGFREGKTTADGFAKTTKNAAADIQKTKIMFIAMAAMALATVIALIASLFGAFAVPAYEAGVRAALTAIWNALVAAIKRTTLKSLAQVITRIVWTATKYAAVGAGLMGGLDGGIQVWQNMTGDRDGFDLKSIKNSFIGGAIGGAVFGAGAGGARSFIGKVFGPGGKNGHLPGGKPPGEMGPGGKPPGEVGPGGKPPGEAGGGKPGGENPGGGHEKPGGGEGTGKNGGKEGSGGEKPGFDGEGAGKGGGEKHGTDKNEGPAKGDGNEKPVHGGENGGSNGGFGNNKSHQPNSGSEGRPGGSEGSGGGKKVPPNALRFPDGTHVPGYILGPVEMMYAGMQVGLVGVSNYLVNKATGQNHALWEGMLSGLSAFGRNSSISPKVDTAIENIGGMFGKGLGDVLKGLGNLPGAMHEKLTGGGHDGGPFSDTTPLLGGEDGHRTRGDSDGSSILSHPGSMFDETAPPTTPLSIMDGVSHGGKATLDQFLAHPETTSGGPHGTENTSGPTTISDGPGQSSGLPSSSDRPGSEATTGGSLLDTPVPELKTPALGDGLQQHHSGSGGSLLDTPVPELKTPALGDGGQHHSGSGGPTLRVRRVRSGRVVRRVRSVLRVRRVRSGRVVRRVRSVLRVRRVRNGPVARKARSVPPAARTAPNATSPPVRPIRPRPTSRSPARSCRSTRRSAARTTRRNSRPAPRSAPSPTTSEPSSRTAR